MNLKTTPPRNTTKKVSLFVSGDAGSSPENAQRARWKIALPTIEGIYFEKVEEIVSLEAKGNYTLIHFIDRKKMLICKTLQEMERCLGAENQFVRIHRSSTINLNLLEKYQKGKGGFVVMEDQRTIRVSAGKKQYFLKALEKYFGE